MHLRVNPKSKTLWLQIAAGGAWLTSADVRAALCAHMDVAFLGHCALTAAAYMIQLRRRPVLALITREKSSDR